MKKSIELGGGLTGTVSLFVSVFRSEGVNGVIWRLTNARKMTQMSLFADSEENGESDIGRNDYAEWVKRYDALNDVERKIIKKSIEKFQILPKISIVMPVYNPNVSWLNHAIESVRVQLYENWELCIADDCSTDKKIIALLQSISELDSRIKIRFRLNNGHISEASNTALAMVSGEWIALLDHDDVLPEHALYCVAKTILQNRDCALIYSDEDKLDLSGVRQFPYFKCDWNEDLFLSHNLISHLGVYRADIVKQIGGFRLGFEGAQDYDLVLRFIENIKPTQIIHIPKVLYHWRIHGESTARAGDAKPYALSAGQKAINEHFLRMKINATVNLTEFGYRVRYALPASPPMVSIIIPTRNGLKLIKQCLDSIERSTDYQSYEILVIDNASDDPEIFSYFEEIEKMVHIRVLRDKRPFNFSALNNFAVAQCRGEVIVMLNNDVEVINDDWLTELVSHALRPNVGAVGAKLLYPSNTYQHCGVVLGLGGVAGHAFKGNPRFSHSYFGRANLTSSFSAVTGACLAVRKSLYQLVHGLNEMDLPVAFNDVDFCLKLKEAGYRNIWTPYAILYHHESATRGLEDTLEKQQRFTKEALYMKGRWGDVLIMDPAYSPNLTIEHEDFSFAWPPRVNNYLEKESEVSSVVGF